MVRGQRCVAQLSYMANIVELRHRHNLRWPELMSLYNSTEESWHIHVTQLARQNQPESAFLSFQVR